MGRLVARIVVALLTGFAALLGVEILLARGTEPLQQYPRAALGGRVGSGDGAPLRITWIGDSTGEGVGASSVDKILPRLIATELGRPVDLTVLAVSGATVLDALREQLPSLSGTSPDWVFVGIGSNDVVHLTPRRRFRRQLSELLRAVTASDPERVIVLGIGEFASTPLFAQPLRFIVGARAHALDSDVQEVARAHAAIYVDVAGYTGRQFVDDPARFHARDRFHPSDAGYRLWVDATLETLRDARLIE